MAMLIRKKIFLKQLFNNFVLLDPIGAPLFVVGGPSVLGAPRICLGCPALTTALHARASVRACVLAGATVRKNLSFSSSLLLLRLRLLLLLILILPLLFSFF